MVDKRQTTVREVKELIAANHHAVLSVTLCFEPIKNIGRPVRSCLEMEEGWDAGDIG